MKVLLCMFCFHLTALVWAQDYFAIVKNNSTSYHYPLNAKLKLIDPQGSETYLRSNDSIEVTGDYRLEVTVPWRNTPEVIKADGGTLGVFILPQKSRNIFDGSDSKKSNVLGKNKNTIRSSKPKATYRDISKSSEETGRYNLLIKFDNGMVFRYKDGEARAWQGGKEIEVTNRYLVQGSDYLLKLSFDPKDGELWYVFDSTNK